MGIQYWSGGMTHPRVGHPPSLWKVCAFAEAKNSEAIAVAATATEGILKKRGCGGVVLSLQLFLSLSTFHLHFLLSSAAGGRLPFEVLTIS